MNQYYKNLFEHEYWANLKVLESIIHSSTPPQRAIEIFSHIIAAQRIWLDRIMAKKNEVRVWEVFDVNIMLELLEINFADINKVIKKEEMGQLIAYHNTKGDSFTNTISEIFSHLLLHSAYHRGQVVILLKGNIEQLPMTDYILFKR